MQSCRQEDEARRPGPKMSQIATNGLSPPSSIVSRGLSGDLSPSLPSTNPPDTPPMDISDLSAAPISEVDSVFSGSRQALCPEWADRCSRSEWTDLPG